MCGMNGFGAEWCGDIFILCNTTLKMALLLHKTALSPKLWSQTVQGALMQILQDGWCHSFLDWGIINNGGHLPFKNRFYNFFSIFLTFERGFTLKSIRGLFRLQCFSVSTKILSLIQRQNCQVMQHIGDGGDKSPRNF